MTVRTATRPPAFTVRQRISALRNLAPFLVLVWRVNRGLAVLSVVQRVVRALIPVTALYVAKLIIDEVLSLGGSVAGSIGWQALVASGQLTHLTTLLLIEAGIAVLADVLGRVGTVLDSILGEQFTIATSVQLMEHTATLDLRHLEDSDLQDCLERARRQSGGGTWLLGQLTAIIQDVITVAGLSIGIITYTPWLVGLLLLTLVPGFFGEVHFSSRAYVLSHEHSHRRRELEYALHTGASVETAKEVKVFDLAPFLVERFRRLAGEMYHANRALAVKRASCGAVLTTVGTLGYYSAYASVIWYTLTGRFSIGDLTFLAGSFAGLRRLMDGFLSRITSLGAQALYLDDLFSYLRVKPAVVTPANALRFPMPIRSGIRFEDVGFRYPGAKGWAVRHLSFDLAAGESVAVVGENGAGKTTIVKLLARLYDPDEGTILLDGRDLRSYDLAEVRTNVGVIFQDFVRYQMTATENIGIGRIEAMADHTRIRDAARRSLADEVIRRLPEGYQQIVGRRFRTGVDLSLGEWQKIAIARAYMRDAPILVLDEPTASLDARSEYEIFQRFRDLSRGKTVLLISHRFSSVRMADRVLVLSDGAIEAAGAHDDLLTQSARYADLFELQATGYR